MRSCSKEANAIAADGDPPQYVELSLSNGDNHIPQKIRFLAVFLRGCHHIHPGAIRQFRPPGGPELGMQATLLLARMPSLAANHSDMIISWSTSLAILC